jgi:hypothetical protein
MEALDTKAQTWAKLPDVPSRCRASAACSHNGFIYVYGGFDVDLKIESNNRICTFNCTTSQWLDVSTNYDFRPQCKRSHHSLTECNGLLVAIGGMNGYRSISDTEYVVMSPPSTSNHSAANEEELAASQMINDGLPAEIIVTTPDLAGTAAFSPSAGLTHEAVLASEESFFTATGRMPAAALDLLHPQLAIPDTSAPASRVLSLKERLSGALAVSKALLNKVSVDSAHALSTSSSDVPVETNTSAQTPSPTVDIAPATANRLLPKVAVIDTSNMKRA